MIKDQIIARMKQALKAQERLSLEAVRYALALIQNAEIDNRGELTDEQVIKLLQGEVRKRKEAIDQIRAGGREDLVQEEEAKVKVLQEFLPEGMGEGEISKLVDQIIGESAEKDFGRIMKQVMERVAGRAEGKIVAEVVRGKLTA